MTVNLQSAGPPSPFRCNDFLQEHLQTYFPTSNNDRQKFMKSKRATPPLLNGDGYR